MAKDGKLKVLHITAMYPSEEYPALGSYVKSQVTSLDALVDNEIFIIQGLKGAIPYLLSVPKLLKHLYSSRFDVIHAHYGNLSSLVKLLYWGKAPIVTSYCGDDLSGTVTNTGRRSVKSLLFRKINIILSKKDNCSIVKSKFLANQIKNAKRVEILPNGVDTFQFKTIDKSYSRNYLKLKPSDKLIILFPADPNIPSKNFKLLHETLTSLDYSKFEILTFKGNKINHADIPYYFNSADIVAFTSLSEGSPNVIKEAMACNSKIYSTPCGDVEWLLRDVEGSKVLSYQLSEWTNQLASIIKNDKETISNSREQLLAKQLDIESIARKLLNIYLSVSKAKK